MIFSLDSINLTDSTTLEGSAEEARTLTSVLIANKKLVFDHYEELTNRKNLAAIEDQVADDFIDHEAPPHLPTGPEGIRQWLQIVYAAFPDLHVQIEDMVAESDRVAVRAVWRGTHRGAFMGIAPSGREFAFKGLVFWRIRDGRIAERWATLDLLGLTRQLQASPL